MAKGGKVQHWKHGWIPLTAYAQAIADGKKPPDKNSAAGQRPAVLSPEQKARAIGILRRKRYSPSNPNSYGEQVTPDPTEMTAEARGGGRPYSAAYMTPDGRFTPEREALHRKIIEDHLRGIEPTGKQPVQFMNGGGPGSGKSSLRAGDNGKLTGYPATREADELTGEFNFNEPAQAALIDPDAIKAMFPEVRDARAAGATDWAQKSHEESSYLAKRIHAASLDRGIDVLYDGTGDGGVESVQKKVDLARGKGYRVEANYIYLDPNEGVRRATERAGRTGRVVPTEAIIETYKDVSTTFGQLAQQEGVFDTLRVFDNNASSADRKAPAKLVAEIREGTPDIRDPEAYRAFLALGV